ncbi:MAG TPA: hypothetical protein PK443_01835 [bacterium]|nr:hypothetical protein [bacterium]
MKKVLGLSFVLLLIASCKGSYYGVAQKEDPAANPQTTSCSGGMDCNMNYCDALKVNQKEGCQLRTNLAFIEICPNIINSIKKEAVASTSKIESSAMLSLEKSRINTDLEITEKPQELCKVFDFSNIDCKIAGTEEIQTNDFLSAILLCAQTISSCKLDIDLEGLSNLYADCKSGKITTFNISCEEEEQKCQEPFVYNDKTKTCDCPAPFVYSLKAGTCACPANTTYNLRTRTCDPTITQDPCSGKCREGEICVITQTTFTQTVSCQKVPCKTDRDCPEKAVCGLDGLCTTSQEVLQLLE